MLLEISFFTIFSRNFNF